MENPVDFVYPYSSVNVHIKLAFIPLLNFTDFLHRVQ